MQKDNVERPARKKNIARQPMLYKNINDHSVSKLELTQFLALEDHLKRDRRLLRKVRLLQMWQMRRDA